MQPAITKEEIEIALTKFFHALIQHTFQKKYGLDWFENELLPRMISCAQSNQTETDKKYGAFITNKGTNAKLTDMDVTVSANVLLFDEKYQMELTLDNSQKQLLHELRTDKNKLMSHSGLLTDSTRFALFSRVVSDLQMAADSFELASIDDQLAIEIETLQRNLYQGSNDSSLGTDLGKPVEENNNPFYQQYLEGERMLDLGNMKDAFGILLELAELGYDLSIIRLAEFYIKGIGTPVDLAHAEKWLMTAVDFGNEKAASLLEKLQEMNRLQKEAQHGNSTAMVKLGVFYESGDLVDKDIHKALEYYKKAAESGSFLAKKRIEALAVNGEYAALLSLYPTIKETVSKDEKQKLILQALAQSTGTQQWKEIIALFADEKDLMYEVGKALYYDNTSPGNIEKCRLIAEIGTDAEYPELINLLGLLYRHGKGVEKDIDKAGELFGRAMDLGFLKGFYNLIHIAYTMKQGSNIIGLRKTYDFCQYIKDKRIEMSVDLLKQLHDKGLILGYGKLCPHLWNKDSREEAEVLMKAARLGIEPAYLAVANCYFYGHGDTEIDKEEALYWYRKSNDRDAYWQIAEIYNEAGPYQDKKQALYWYERNGSASSYLRMGHIYDEEGQYHDSKKAFECFKKAADMNEQLQGSLGLCYFYGKGTERNLELAAKCFKTVAGNSLFLTGLGTVNYLAEDHPCYFHFREYQNIAYELGLMYQNGIEMEPIELFAFQCFQAAAYKTDNSAALYECAKYVMRRNIKYKAGRNLVANSVFYLDENGFPSRGRGHITGEQMLLTSAESGYMPAIKCALQLYDEGELGLAEEIATKLREMEIE